MKIHFYELDFETMKWNKLYEGDSEYIVNLKFCKKIDDLSYLVIIKFNYFFK